MTSWNSGDGAEIFSKSHMEQLAKGCHTMINYLLSKIIFPLYPCSWPLDFTVIYKNMQMRYTFPPTEVSLVCGFLWQIYYRRICTCSISTQASECTLSFLYPLIILGGLESFIMDSREDTLDVELYLTIRLNSPFTV